MIEFLLAVINTWQYQLFSAIVMLGSACTIVSLLITINSLIKERAQLLGHLRAAYPVLTEEAGSQKESVTSPARDFT